MNNMEYEIKALKIRVNILLVMGGLSFVLTIAKLIFPAFTSHATPAPTNTNSVQPTRNGRAWIIADDYRIVPITAELTENE